MLATDGKGLVPFDHVPMESVQYYLDRFELQEEVFKKIPETTTKLARFTRNLQEISELLRRSIQVHLDRKFSECLYRR